MAEQRFTAPIDNFVSVSQARLTAVHQEGTKRLIDIAQTPTGKGGNMHVDTGFLRNSGQASLTGMPSGPTRGEKNGVYEFEPNVAELVIAGARPGGTIWFGWTAAYARPREAKDGFLRLAVQQWPQIIAAVVTELKSRIK